MLVKEQIMNEKMKVYSFRTVLVQNVDENSKPETIDVSKEIGNIFYNQTNDISMIDKAREIYYKGETSFNENEVRHFLEVIINTPLIVAPVKIAIREMFNK